MRLYNCMMILRCLFVVLLQLYRVRCFSRFYRVLKVRGYVYGSGSRGALFRGPYNKDPTVLSRCMASSNTEETDICQFGVVIKCIIFII